MVKDLCADCDGVYTECDVIRRICDAESNAKIWRRGRKKLPQDI